MKGCGYDELGIANGSTLLKYSSYVMYIARIMEIDGDFVGSHRDHGNLPMGTFLQKI